MDNAQGVKSKNFAILTYGCQMNKYDSERIAGILLQESYSRTDDLSRADLILLNTCTVRDKADQKVFSKLGRLRALKMQNPRLIIGVCGCMPQVQGPAVLHRSQVVDFVFGTKNIHQLNHILSEVKSGKRVARILPEAPGNSCFFPDAFARESEYQAWVSIMTGCNNGCTYCIVPRARGRERSRKVADILKEISGLARQGYKEVTLLGQNVNSYGKDLSPSSDFPGMIEEVNAIKGIERIRFMTSHPKDLSDRLIRVMADSEKVCEHLHLPLQSGSNRILRRMNRGYTLKEYQEKVERLRASISGLALTTDLIVGFPGESEEDFRETERAVREIGFQSSFIFKYSPRSRTPAATFSNQIDDQIMSERFQRLELIQKDLILSSNRALLKKKVEVLVSGKSKTNPMNLMGRTRTNKIVVFQGPESLKGRLIRVEITRAGLYSLRACLGDAI